MGFVVPAYPTLAVSPDAKNISNDTKKKEFAGVDSWCRGPRAMAKCN